jgi:hypothetical protein
MPYASIQISSEASSLCYFSQTGPFDCSWDIPPPQALLPQLFMANVSRILNSIYDEYSMHTIHQDFQQWRTRETSVPTRCCSLCGPLTGHVLVDHGHQRRCDSVLWHFTVTGRPEYQAESVHFSKIGFLKGCRKMRCYLGIPPKRADVEMAIITPAQTMIEISSLQCRY